MSNFVKAAVAGLSIFAFSGVTQAEVLSASVQANVEQPISLAEIEPMDFATILPNNLADQIVMSQATNSPSLTSTTGNSTLSGTFTRGLVRITGTPNATATVQVDASTTVTSPNGDTMTVDSFAANRTAPLIGASGETDIIIGATLNIAANQPAGLYTGTYNVTVNYQ